MALANPKIRETKKFTEVIGYDKPFILSGIRTVKARTADYGDGEMVLLDVRGEEAELGIWGTYLLKQAEAAEASDFDQHYKIVEDKIVTGFSRRPVKALVPCEPDGTDIPF